MVLLKSKTYQLSTAVKNVFIKFEIIYRKWPIPMGYTSNRQGQRLNRYWDKSVGGKRILMRDSLYKLWKSQITNLNVRRTIDADVVIRAAIVGDWYKVIGSFARGIRRTHFSSSYHCPVLNQSNEKHYSASIIKYNLTVYKYIQVSISIHL